MELHFFLNLFLRVPPVAEQQQQIQQQNKDDSDEDMNDLGALPTIVQPLCNHFFRLNDVPDVLALALVRSFGKPSADGLEEVIPVEIASVGDIVDRDRWTEENAKLNSQPSVFRQ